MIRHRAVEAGQQCAKLLASQPLGFLHGEERLARSAPPPPIAARRTRLKLSSSRNCSSVRRTISRSSSEVCDASGLRSKVVSPNDNLWWGIGRHSISGTLHIYEGHSMGE